MPRRNARGPQPAPDSFKRFLAENVKKTPTKLPAVPDDAAPLPERVTPQDLLRQSGRAAIQPTDVVLPGSVAHESLGAMQQPMMRHRHGLDTASPAPFVATGDPALHTFTAALTGERVTPGPRPRVIGADVGGAA